jgi:hypothetical protein
MAKLFIIISLYLQKDVFNLHFIFNPANKIFTSKFFFV